jgi:hypothetical protein
MKRASNLAIGCLLLLGIVGCGPSHVDVSGRVLLNDRAIRVGAVMLVGHDGMPLTVAIEDGHYAARVPVVHSYDPLMQLKSFRSDGQATPEIEAEYRSLREQWFPLPERYGNPRQSGLVFHAKSSPTTFDIVLEE